MQGTDVMLRCGINIFGEKEDQALMKYRHQNSSQLSRILTYEQINVYKSIIQNRKKKMTSDRSYTKPMHMQAKPSCGSQLLQHASERK